MDTNIRHAVVRGQVERLAEIERYLPHGYRAEALGADVWIHGRDNAGWTLDDYVIPRLASGLIRAEERPDYPNRPLDLTAEHVALAEVLLRALAETNRLDGYFAQEVGGTYGKVKAALVNALAAAIATDNGPIYFGDAEVVARCLFEEAIDNGENIAYQLDLWNDDRITVAEGQVRP